MRSSLPNTSNLYTKRKLYTKTMILIHKIYTSEITLKN